MVLTLLQTPYSVWGSATAAQPDLWRHNRHWWHMQWEGHPPWVGSPQNLTWFFLPSTFLKSYAHVWYGLFQIWCWPSETYKVSVLLNIYRKMLQLFILFIESAHPVSESRQSYTHFARGEVSPISLRWNSPSGHATGALHLRNALLVLMLKFCVVIPLDVDAIKAQKLRTTMAKIQQVLCVYMGRGNLVMASYKGTKLAQHWHIF